MSPPGKTRANEQSGPPPPQEVVPPMLTSEDLRKQKQHLDQYEFLASPPAGAAAAAAMPPHDGEMPRLQFPRTAPDMAMMLEDQEELRKEIAMLRSELRKERLWRVQFEDRVTTEIQLERHERDKLMALQEQMSVTLRRIQDTVHVRVDPTTVDTNRVGPVGHTLNTLIEYGVSEVDPQWTTLEQKKRDLFEEGVNKVLGRPMRYLDETERRFYEEALDSIIKSGMRRSTSKRKRGDDDDAQLLTPHHITQWSRTTDFSTHPVHGKNLAEVVAELRKGLHSMYQRVGDRASAIWGVTGIKKPLSMVPRTRAIREILNLASDLNISPLEAKPLIQARMSSAINSSHQSTRRRPQDP